MQILTSPEAISALSGEWRKQGLTIALVPTMGYFHEGHLTLMRKARKLADKVVVSLFVNPSQFGPGEDLAAYPRNLEKDSELAKEQGADALFTPAPEVMYAPDHATWVEVPVLSQVLCGATRPTHFRGVCTVVLKLFNIVMPQVAVFGEKDWQQLTVLRRMVGDLNVPVRLEGVPIVREKDGLALSSRNAYLTPQERAAAPAIYQGLQAMRREAIAGETSAKALQAAFLRHIQLHLPSARPDYMTIMHPDTLQEIVHVNSPAMVAVAVRLGKARLIDNLRLL